MSTSTFMENSKKTIDLILDGTKRGLNDFKSKITSDFNKQLNMLTLFVCMITIVVLLIVLCFSNMMSNSSFYFSIIQYVSIGIFSLVLISYFVLAFFWYKRRRE